MTADLVVSALEKALRKGKIKPEAIIHSDRGSQYGSNAFRSLLDKNALRQSMSGKGNCYDNAQAESFFSRFKAELIENGVFEDINQARLEIFSYIERLLQSEKITFEFGLQKSDRIRDGIRK